MRRALTILAVVIVLAGAGAAAYYYFFASTADLTVAPGGSSALPVAGDAPQTPNDTIGTTTAPVEAPVTVSARLVQVSKGPVALGEAVTSTAATASSSASTAVTFIDRQSGNVFQYRIPDGTLTRTSNRTVPGIQSAAWVSDASRAFVRYLSGTDSTTINTYALPADGSDGFFLSQNLSDIAVSASNILTLASGTNGSVASLAQLDATHTAQLFTTPLSNLHVAFAGKGRYLAYTSPSAALPGVAFLVDSSGNFSRIAGPLTGLVAKASPSGKWVLVSYTRDGAMQMELIDTATGEALSLPVATIADKCVWAADDSAIYCGIPVNPPAAAAYPDDWYQGAVSFSDRIWKIQVSGRYAQFVLDFTQENNAPVDAVALAIDPLLTTLVFVNKNDGSLWSYSL